MAYVRRSNSMFKKKPKKKKKKTVEELNKKIYIYIYIYIYKINVLCCNAMVFEVIDLHYYLGVSNM